MRFGLFKNYLKKMYRSTSRLTLTLSGLVLSVFILMSFIIISETALETQMYSVNIYKENNGVVLKTSLNYETYKAYKNNEKYNVYMESYSGKSVVLERLNFGGLMDMSIFGQAIHINENWNLNFLLQGDEMRMERYSSKLLYGRLFEMSEIENGEKVTVIDEVLAELLFGKENAVNEYIEFSITGDDIKFVKYKVIGVIEASEYTKAVKKDIIKAIKDKEDNAVRCNFDFYIPYTSSYEDKTEDYQMNLVFTSNTTSYNDIKYYVNSIYNSNNNIRIDSLITADDMYRKYAERIAETQNTILFSMGIVFVIAGLCIMNTMLFSIKERINEIGIRKAIGAFNNDILSQFIFEGFVYGLLSAIIGICVSISIMSQVVILWGEEIFGRTTRIIISKEAVLLSLAAAILVSVLASIIPAIYASRIKVSQALKFE